MQLSDDKKQLENKIEEFKKAIINLNIEKDKKSIEKLNSELMSNSKVFVQEFYFNLNLKFTKNKSGLQNNLNQNESKILAYENELKVFIFENKFFINKILLFSFLRNHKKKIANLNTKREPQPKKTMN